MNECKTCLRIAYKKNSFSRADAYKQNSFSRAEFAVKDQLGFDKEIFKNRR